MSRFCKVQTLFKDQDSLVQALMETGNWSKDQIEIHNEPQHLFGYKGDQRQEMANLIIRRQFVGRSSNDIGFVKNDDGTYGAIISNYDKSRYNDKWIGALKGSYAFYQIEKQMRAKGRRVVRERLSNGRQTITVTGYR